MTDEARRYQDVARELRRHIVAQGFNVGDRLMTERQIAELLNVSRGLVRDAVIMLEVEGTVQVRKGSGIYLTRSPEGEVQPDHDDIGPFELLQARQLLESAVAGFAAAMVTKADVTRMREALESERRNIEAGSDDYSGDERFHRLIAEATQNGVLVSMVEDLWAKRSQSRMWEQLHHRIFDETYRRQWLDDHHEILAALQARDSNRARQAMWDHLTHVSDTLMALSDVDDPAFDGYLFAPRAKIAI
ncbi:HTH-type transcriptional regulator LutR [Aquimixticola soesokkakensis]|uniref:HTH-type transcriptional regulator LutR n=1 Tax=Aquimixticola soesokkakensis TaxID=1519096 RepID=A0A1Y5RUS5_9RHOB|nr:FCD domain-containing protein [Aquimixticola soesokkakensis]SLN23182.1 HTH-type transcriptional regulator LutR [Aquimixticola soesokkakensis]